MISSAAKVGRKRLSKCIIVFGRVELSVESVEARAPSVDVPPFLIFIVPFDRHISAMDGEMELGVVHMISSAARGGWKARSKRKMGFG